MVRLRWSGHWETVISTKHLRLSIDFHITIADMPPEDDGLNPPDPVYHARQARLLAAVKNNPQVLTRWMRQVPASFNEAGL